MYCGNLLQVCMANVISVLRCIISMSLSSADDDIIDRVGCFVSTLNLLSRFRSLIIYILAIFS